MNKTIFILTTKDRVLAHSTAYTDPFQAQKEIEKQKETGKELIGIQLHLNETEYNKE